MPELRKNANLEYNPDSIYGASKKLAVIALKNLENSGENPDLDSSGKNTGDLKGFYEEFLGDLVNISTNYKQLGSYIQEYLALIKKFKYDEYDDLDREEKKLWDAWETMGFDVEGAIHLYNELKEYEDPKINSNKYSQRTKHYGTVKGGAFKSSVEMPRFTKRFEGRPEPTSWAEANVNGEIMRGGADRQQVQPVNMWANMGDNDGGDSSSDEDESSFDEDSLNSSSDESAISYNAPHPNDGIGNNAEGVAQAIGEDPLEQDEYDEGDDILLNDLKDTYVKPNTVILIISKLISLISKANILFNGRIKKNINYFDKLDIQDMADKVETIVETHDKTPLEVINISVSNGNELVDALKKSLDKLYNDVAIAIKSYSSQRQQGGSRRAPKMVHQKAGISNINMNPLSKYKNCPTKYLL
jgi:hypothetical protein